MKVSRRQSLTYASLVCAALLTACTNPGHNNNPSQQITDDRVGCLAATDFFAVYFSVYLQPSIENPDSEISRDIFRSYCNDLPTPGKVFLTADLVGDELKGIPIAIRIVQEEPAESDRNPESSKILRTISVMPAKIYASGVIESQFELNGSGNYAVYLIRGGEESVSDGDELRISLNVGADSGEKPSMRRIILFVAASGLALIGFVAFRSMRRSNPL